MPLCWKSYVAAQIIWLWVWYNETKQMVKLGYKMIYTFTPNHFEDLGTYLLRVKPPLNAHVDVSMKQNVKANVAAIFWGKDQKIYNNRIMSERPKKLYKQNHVRKNGRKGI